MNKLMTAGLALSLGLALSGVAKADISIAVAGPITGSNAALGDQIVAGAKQAVADINAAGGVLGQKLVLEVGDDACDPKQAVSVAEQLAAKKVVFVAGHVCSSSSIPASAVYNDAGIIQISPASTNPVYTDSRPGPGTFRVCGRDDQQGAVAGAFLAKTFAGKNIAIVDDKSAYGKGLADETRKFFNQAGGKEVLDDEYNAGEKDYTALVSKLKAANVDVLYVGGYYTEAGLFARQMKDQGMKTLLVSGDALVTDDFWKVAGDAGEGTLMTFSPDPRKNPDNAALVDVFRKAGKEPEGYTLYTYAAVQVWAQAAAAAGSTDFTKVAAAITGGDFKTALGELKFDAKGDVSAPGYVFYEWKNGKYDYLTP
ncbi:MAG: branched-chain amino acid ABC transporter substrate-binding protein [Bauldia sp.]